jgi:hypothetical protein
MVRMGRVEESDGRHQPFRLVLDELRDLLRHCRFYRNNPKRLAGKSMVTLKRSKSVDFTQ